MTTTKPLWRTRTMAGLVLATTLLGSTGCSVGSPSGASGASEASGSSAMSQSDAGGATSSSADLAYDADIRAPASAVQSLADTASTSRAAGQEGAADAAEALSADRAIIRTGRLDLRSDDVPGVRADLVTAIAGLGGEVASEESSGDRRGRLERVILIAEVPTDRFAEAMDAFAGLARTTQRSSDALDVTEEVVDVAARVRTQAAAVRRMEDLLDRADTVGEVIRVESQLVRRQADLEALQARQDSLAQKTSTATIQVDLQAVREPRVAEARSAVAAGLATGWDAFGDATRALVVLVATLLPFAVALGVLGVPVLWWRRRRMSRSASPA